MQIHLGMIIMLFIILILSSALAITYYTKTVDNQARIIPYGQIQTYTDVSCTQILYSHNWGDFNVSSGDSVKTLDVYLKNEGNTKVNVTWAAYGFTSYNGTTIQYENPSWKLYLVNVDDGGVRLKPENDTTPSKVQLFSGEVVHLRFYLTANMGSASEDLTFQTTFRSQDD